MLPGTKVKSLAPAGIRGTFMGKERGKETAFAEGAVLCSFANPFHRTVSSNESTYSAKTYLDVLISFTPDTPPRVQQREVEGGCLRDGDGVGMG